ncbi:MAG: GNAT family N-acetyltransferase, partial [Phycisphaerales bacterium]|nr:GNAT family N-acetyltransferase [Phycisphaerales bacterium]
PWTAPKPLPESFDTPRLTLRPWRPSEGPAMLAALNADRANLLPWLPWVASDSRTVEECTFHIERFRRERENPAGADFIVGIFDRATGEALGGTGFHRMRTAFHEAEIGYWIRADRQRRGYCTEAVAGLLTWAFTPQDRAGWGLRRIHIQCAAANVASATVPRKLGLRQEALIRAERWIPSLGWADSLVFAVLAQEWDCAASRLRPAPPA